MKKFNEYSINISNDLIKKYNVSGSYYTSYPVLSEWSNDFSCQDFASALKMLCTSKNNNPLFLYVHFPFCAKQCYYCICNSIITQGHHETQKYLDYLLHEIDLLINFFEEYSFTPDFKMIHLGGGTPNLMNENEFDTLIEKIKTFVRIEDINEFVIEVDPRTATKEKLKYYSEKGINRLSFGIQDFNPNVQKAINRIQSPEKVEQLLSPDIKKLFKSINFDILYGLPLQSRESFRKTMEIVLKINPDRITLLKYAHMPNIRKHQNFIREEDMPDYVEGQRIFIETVDYLLDNGYEHVGIDHFARPHDNLAKAMKNKTLWRNFIGFTPGGIHNIIGIGPTSTSSFNDFYVQNVYNLSEYYGSIDENKFPVLRGYKLNADDLIRREIINKIVCYGILNFKDIERMFDIKFNKYFKYEISMLDDLIKDGFLLLDDESITVTSPGRIFIRHICKVFDKKYSRKENVYRISGP